MSQLKVMSDSCTNLTEEALKTVNIGVALIAIEQEELKPMKTTFSSSLETLVIIIL
jgi:hypothetical protein